MAVPIIDDTWEPHTGGDDQSCAKYATFTVGDEEYEVYGCPRAYYGGERWFIWYAAGRPKRNRHPFGVPHSALMAQALIYNLTQRGN